MVDAPEWLRSYPPAQRAALIVHLAEIAESGRSDLSHVVVAERARVGRSAVVMAIATAWARGHISVMPREGEPSIIRLPRG